MQACWRLSGADEVHARSRVRPYTGKDSRSGPHCAAKHAPASTTESREVSKPARAWAPGAPAGAPAAAGKSSRGDPGDARGSAPSPPAPVTPAPPPAAAPAPASAPKAARASSAPSRPAGAKAADAAAAATAAAAAPCVSCLSSTTAQRGPAAQCRLASVQADTLGKPRGPAAVRQRLPPTFHSVRLTLHVRRRHLARSGKQRGRLRTHRGKLPCNGRFRRSDTTAPAVRRAPAKDSPGGSAVAARAAGSAGRAPAGVDRALLPAERPEREPRARPLRCLPIHACSMSSGLTKAAAARARASPSCLAS